MNKTKPPNHQIYTNMGTNLNIIIAVPAPLPPKWYKRRFYTTFWHCKHKSLIWYVGQSTYNIIHHSMQCACIIQCILCIMPRDALMCVSQWECRPVYAEHNARVQNVQCPMYVKNNAAACHVCRPVYARHTAATVYKTIMGVSHVQ